MIERSILMSAPMVRALLRDVNPKTQTRRVLTPHNSFFGSAPKLFWDHADFSQAWKDGGGLGSAEYLHVPCHVTESGKCAVCDEWDWPQTAHRLWSRIAPATDGRILYADDGDKVPASRLWVKETMKITALDSQALTAGVHYAADDARRAIHCPQWPQVIDLRQRWKSPIFMPRWASRIVRDVTAVRMQRLQEISREDAIAEGVEKLGEFPCITPWRNYMLKNGKPSALNCSIPERSYVTLFDSINGDRASDANPWVMAISFTPVPEVPA